MTPFRYACGLWTIFASKKRKNCESAGRSRTRPSLTGHIRSQKPKTSKTEPMFPWPDAWC